MKKIILLVIDALTKRCLDPLLEQGRLPFLGQLCDRAEINTISYSIFPSITHAALTSISTGHYPRQHGVLGSHWYRSQTNEIAYYSADFELILKDGLSAFLSRFLTKLNDQHLQTDTIFTRLHEAGKTAGSINFLSFAGPHLHQVDLPLILKLLPGIDIETDQVWGPDQLFLGELVSVDVDGVTPLTTDPLRWFGVRDEGTMHFLRQLIEKKQMPDLTIAYFPHNDKRAHDSGPETAHQQLVDLDQMLGDLFAAADGLDGLLSEYTLIVTGDHSQSQVADTIEKAAVDLDSLLEQYAIAPAGEPWETNHELMICPNMRSAVIYARPHVKTEDLLPPLLTDERIDQLIWQDDDDRFHIETQSGKLAFWRGGRAQDRFDNGWDWDGDLSVVDGRLEGESLLFGDYPNAFERIAGVLAHPDSGRLWITARPGSELVVSLTNAHVGGGSHGSLHRLDSEAPLWVAGISSGQIDLLPQPARLVDIAPFCLQLLDT